MGRNVNENDLHLALCLVKLQDMFSILNVL